jgi:hypothetical protein
MSLTESESSRAHFVASIRWLPGILLVSLLSGCTPQSESRHYTVPADDKPMTTDRLRPLFEGTSRPVTVALPDFTAPEGWQKAENDQFSAAAFSVGPSDRPARFTITQTPAAVGVLGQISRWRGQVGLDPLPAAQTADGFPTLAMGNISASFVEMEGEGGESIAGAIASVAGNLWFFKLRGPTETVDEEMPRLRAFCESVRFKDQN